MITFNENIKQHAALGLCALLGLVVFFTLIYAVQQWHHDWAIAHHETAAPTISNVDETADIIAAIPDEHVFGKSFSGNQVPITNLQLRVTGIVKVENEENTAVSKATISISGQPGKIYQAGDSLPYGVKIYDITSDAVILENDGHLEKLPLPREKLQFKSRNTQERL